jgi:DNA mismatch repair protein MutS2
MGARGEIASAPDKHGKVTVQIGTLRTTAAIADVRLDEAPAPNRAEKRTETAVKRRAAPPVAPTSAEEATEKDLAPARTPDATCDLRGERVDDGLGQLDRFLDDALLASRDVVFVIHGHGTGAMKAAVREHLSSHRAVSRTRAGSTREGGDGITVVWLDV